MLLELYLLLLLLLLFELLLSVLLLLLVSLLSLLLLASAQGCDGVVSLVLMKCGLRVASSRLRRRRHRSEGFLREKDQRKVTSKKKAHGIAVVIVFAFGHGLREKGRKVLDQVRIPLRLGDEEDASL